MSGITIAGSATTTSPIQNVGGTGATGLFFLNGWDSHPGTNIENVQAGWTVVGHPTWIVTSTDSSAETVTITGGTFGSGESYQFTSPILSGVIIGNGITIE